MKTLIFKKTENAVLFCEPSPFSSGHAGIFLFGETISTFLYRDSATQIDAALDPNTTGTYCSVFLFGSVLILFNFLPYRMEGFRLFLNKSDR